MASPGPGAYGASECYGSAAAPTELITGGAADFGLFWELH